MNTASPTSTTAPRTSRHDDRRAVEHFRTHTAEHGSCTRLHDAAVAFDELLCAARRHGLADDPLVRRSLGAVVDAIASSITGGDTIAGHASDGGEIGAVLLDRAAARFSTLVIDTEIGRRPCPPPVLTALHAARHSLETADVLLGGPPVSSVVEVVVFGMLRDRSRIEPVLQALAPLRPSTVRLVGTPVPIRSDGARELLDLEYGRSHSSSPLTRPGTPDVHLAGAHLTWIAHMLGEAGHHVVSTDILAAPRSGLAGRGTVVVVGAGLVGTVRAALLRRRLRRDRGRVTAWI
jgi:hypothetical protein